MKGWKTNTGAAVVAIAQLLSIIGVISPEVGEAISTLGGALAGVGLGHKLDRLNG